MGSPHSLDLIFVCAEDSRLDSHDATTDVIILAVNSYYRSNKKNQRCFRNEEPQCSLGKLLDDIRSRHAAFPQ